MQFARWFPMGLGVLVLCAAFVLAGCAPQSAPMPSPSSTSTGAATDAPVFASDEEALAAATEAYTAYLAASDQIVGEGGVDPLRISKYVSRERLDDEKAEFAKFESAGVRSVGRTTFTVFRMQSARYDSTATTSITLYICEDVSAIDVLDASGASLVSATRNPITGWEVGFDMSGDAALVLASRSFWTGSDFC